MKLLSLLTGLTAMTASPTGVSATETWTCDQAPLIIENVRLLGQHNLKTLLIADGKIKQINNADSATAIQGELRRYDGNGAIALPGLIDSHTHFDAIPAAKHLQNDLNTQTEIFPITMRQTLASGVTTARAHLAALPDIALMKELSHRDCFPSPRIVMSGPGLLGGAPTVNARLMRGVAGPEDAIAKIKEIAKLGASWLALHAITRFSEEELTAIINAADTANVKLMADTDSFENLEAALRLPIISGEYINRTTAKTYPSTIMKALKTKTSDFYVVPPLGYYARSQAYANDNAATLDENLFLFIPDALSSVMRDSFHEAFEKDDYITGAIAAFPTFKLKFEQLRNAGAKFVIGSDTGSLGQFHHDAVWQEMAAWQTMGATPDQIIEGATTTPSQMLDMPKVGTLTPGAVGDIVLYTGDIASGEFDRRHVSTVIKGGVVFVSHGEWIGPDTVQMTTSIEAFQSSSSP